MFVVRVQAAARYLAARGQLPNPRLGTVPDLGHATQFVTRDQAEEYLRLARHEFPWEWVIEKVEG